MLLHGSGVKLLPITFAMTEFGNSYVLLANLINGIDTTIIFNVRYYL